MQTVEDFGFFSFADEDAQSGQVSFQVVLHLVIGALEIKAKADLNACNYAKSNEVPI